MDEQNVCGVPDSSAKISRPDCKCRLAVFALPGMGKTTFAKSNKEWQSELGWCVADVDFGDWRKKRNLNRVWRAGVEAKVRDEIYRQFVREEINPILDEVDVILCNEPGVAKYLPQEVVIVTVVPNLQMEELWFKNLVYRCVQNYHKSEDEPSFLELVALEGRDWPKSPSWKIPGSMQFKFGSYDDWGVIYSMMELIA